MEFAASEHVVTIDVELKELQLALKPLVTVGGIGATNLNMEQKDLAWMEINLLAKRWAAATLLRTMLLCRRPRLGRRDLKQLQLMV